MSKNNFSFSDEKIMAFIKYFGLVKTRVLPTAKQIQDELGLSYYMATKIHKLATFIPEELPFGNMSKQTAAKHLYAAAKDIVDLFDATYKPMSDISEYALQDKVMSVEEYKKIKDDMFKANEDRAVPVSQKEFDYEATFTQDDLKKFIPDNPDDDDFVMPDYTKNKK